MNIILKTRLLLTDSQFDTQAKIESEYVNLQILVITEYDFKMMMSKRTVQNNNLKLGQDLRHLESSF